MAMIHGKGGTVTWGTTLVVPAEIMSWSMDATADTAESTNMDSAADWKTFLGGFRTWTATVEAKWDSADVSALLSLGQAEAALTLEIVAGGAQLQGNAINTGSSFNVDKDDIVTVTLTFQGSGALVYAAA